MNKLDLEKLKAVIEREASRGYEPPVRYVSPRQYDVLEKLNSEGKLNWDGTPKLEHMDEFYELMKLNPKEREE